MELTHEFVVPASVQETWDAFNDIESMAGCFPGATVSSVEGDSFKGSCKVKLGPIALVYNGSGKFLDKDAAGHSFKLGATGKDKRGNGTAGAIVTTTMSEVSDGGTAQTQVRVLTDLNITGKPAQFGRGVIQDVSDKLLGQFVECLAATVGTPKAEDPATPVAASQPEPPAAEQLPTTAAQQPPATAAEPPTPASAPPPSPAHKDDALDLGAAVVPILLRTYWKPIAGGLAVLVLLRWLRR